MECVGFPCLGSCAQAVVFVGTSDLQAMQDWSIRTMCSSLWRLERCTLCRPMQLATNWKMEFNGWGASMSSPMRCAFINSMKSSRVGVRCQRVNDSGHEFSFK